MNQNCVISSVFASGSYSDSTYLSYNSEKKLIAAEIIIQTQLILILTTLMLKKEAPILVLKEILLLF